jgi:hypothetical protein
LTRLSWFEPQLRFPIDYQSLTDVLEKIAENDIDPTHAAKAVEALLTDPAEQTCRKVYDALHKCCWNLMASSPSSYGDLTAWRRVFSKASFLMSAGGNEVLSQKAFVLADMVSMGIREHQKGN